MRKLIVAAIALALAGNAALAQQKKPPAESLAFAKKVVSANAFAIQLSELAQDRAHSAEVKALAKEMMADHARVDSEFNSALQAAHITAPAPAQPGAKQKAALLKLRNARGPAFDRALLAAQLAGHKQALSVLRTYAKTGRTPELKGFAQQTLPMVEQHLSKLTELNSQLVAAGRRPTGSGSRAIGPPAERAPRPRQP